MLHVLDPFRFVLIAVAGWMNQWEYQIIDYLREENRVLREQLGERRLRFNDDQRRRLAVKAKGLTRRLLDEMSPIVTWETLLSRRMVDAVERPVMSKNSKAQPCRRNRAKLSIEFWGDCPAPLCPVNISNARDTAKCGAINA
jgi:hypothetical protein